MNAKKMVILMTVFLVSFFTVLAQTEKKVDDPLECLKKDLNLTEQQVKLIKPVWEKAAADIKALKSKATMEKPVDKNSIQKIEEDREAQTVNILTPEQKMKYKEMKLKEAEKPKCSQAPAPAPEKLKEADKAKCPQAPAPAPEKKK
ncbi:hypothetical protein KJ762_11935 [bacterium]|nr:hypothetical protein [bacterium]MBU1064005.1 hypothetical protein [bacterium]MBU1635202.1 hypothetical protein [bacterium]MBU1875247.1 hypothetical protein [bacterium]